MGSSMPQTGQIACFPWLVRLGGLADHEKLLHNMKPVLCLI
jgi:hypothetical protein